MSSLTILQSRVQPKKVVLVDLGYPYGKKVYMSGSVVSVAAQLMAVGHSVDIADFNIDNPSDNRVRDLFSQADIIGASVMGSPGIPAAIQFVNQVSRQHPRAQIVLGGQVVSQFTRQQFARVFGALATQIAGDEDSAELFGALPSAYDIPYQSVWDKMGDERLKEYLLHEFALVLSQGCIFTCKFCSAKKGQKETFRTLLSFSRDIMYLLKKAKEFGILEIQCYASSLDFFQTPDSIFPRMEALAVAQHAVGVKARVRCLTCMNTFLAASRQRQDFAELIQHSGLWCLGFGVDGPTTEVWQEQHKSQNRMSDVEQCYDLCEQIGVRAEVLTVMGYPGDSPKRLWQTVRHLKSFVRRWHNTVLRPYVAREVLPGNDGWYSRSEVVTKLISRPQLFYDLDICGLSNITTHPKSRWKRWLVNVAYLYIILRYGPFGRCATSPLLPQGGRGWFAKFAKLVNRYMPFDR